jgi:hypothetical protein
MSKISLVSRQILDVVEMSNWFFGSRITPSVDLNEILQYSVLAHSKLQTATLHLETIVQTFQLPSYTSQFPCDTSHPNAPHSSARCSHQPRVRELLGVSTYSRKYLEDRKISPFWLISPLDKLPAHHQTATQPSQS